MRAPVETPNLKNPAEVVLIPAIEEPASAPTGEAAAIKADPEGKSA